MALKTRQEYKTLKQGKTLKTRRDGTEQKKIRKNTQIRQGIKDKTRRDRTKSEKTLK